MEHVPPHPLISSDASARADLRLAVCDLYASQHVRMLRFAAARLGDAEIARDAVNETFVQALRRLSALRDPEALESWVWSILVNETKNQRRARSAWPTAQLDDDDLALEAPELPVVDHDLRRLIRDLPDRQRTVLFLRYYGDLTAVQIAELLGIADSTVRATLHHAHTALRRALTEGDSHDEQ